MFMEELTKKLAKLPKGDPIFVFANSGYYGPRFKRVKVEHDLPKDDFLDRLIACGHSETFDRQRMLYVPDIESISSYIKRETVNTVVKFIKKYLKSVKGLQRPKSSVLFKFWASWRGQNAVDANTFFQIAEFIDQHDLLNHPQTPEAKELGVLLQRIRKQHVKK